VPWITRSAAASHRRGPYMTPGLSMRDLRWTEWHYNRFLSAYSGFHPVSFIPLLLHIYSFIYHRRCIILATVTIPLHRPLVTIPLHRPLVTVPLHRPLVTAPLHRPLVTVPLHRPLVTVPLHRPLVTVPLHRPLVTVPLHRTLVCLSFYTVTLQCVLAL
jgi:hypothetical protein